MGRGRAVSFNIMEGAIPVANPVIPTDFRTVSGSTLIDVLAESLSTIKSEDNLTDTEIGRFMGKGVDAGKAYRTGYAEMGVVAFLRACQLWNGRFASKAFEKIGMKLVPIAAAPVNDQTVATRLAKLMLELSLALEDGKIDELELQRMKRTLVDAAEGIDALRERAA
jgi:hypothetical protein